MTKAEGLEAIISGIEAYQKHDITPLELWRVIVDIVKTVEQN